MSHLRRVSHSEQPVGESNPCPLIESQRSWPLDERAVLQRVERRSNPRLLVFSEALAPSQLSTQNEKAGRHLVTPGLARASSKSPWRHKRGRCAERPFAHLPEASPASSCSHR